MSTLTYVNYKGDALPPPASSAQQRMPRKSGPDEFHKGWRVVGLPPGSQQEAEMEHTVKQNAAVAKGLEPKPFDLTLWLMNARKKSVRAKPYELKDSAQVCADLAAKAGWQAVEVRQIAKGKGITC